MIEPRVHQSGTQFVRADGTPIVLRGVNIAGSASLDPIATTMGANLVRLVTPWSDIEAVRGRYDTAALVSRIKAFADRGTNVLVDFHQFNWSPYFGGGGIPLWYYSDKRFSTSESGAAKAAFWTTEKSRNQPLYHDFISAVMTACQDQPNVVGYEIINEPQPGKLGNTHAATQAIFDWQAPFASQIRSADPHRTVFFQTRQGGCLGAKNVSIASWGNLDRCCLDLHNYFQGRDGTGYTTDQEAWQPGDRTKTHNQESTNYQGTEANQWKVLGFHFARTQGWGIPLLVGEWGVRRDDVHGATYMTQMFDLLRKYRINWTYWSLGRQDIFATLNADDTLRPIGQLLKAELSRPVP